MLREMSPVRSWPVGVNHPLLHVPAIRTSEIRPGRALLLKRANTDLSYCASRQNAAVSGSFPEPRSRYNQSPLRNTHNDSPRQSRGKYINNVSVFPTIANGNVSTSSSPFPGSNKSRPGTNRNFLDVESPIRKTKSLPSQLSSRNNDFWNRDKVRHVNGYGPTRDFVRESTRLSRDITRLSLQREPTVLLPSKHGYHRRSKSPTYIALIEAKEYLDALLSKKIKDFLKTREGIRATNNSAMTEMTSHDIIRFPSTTPESNRGRTTLMLNDHFETHIADLSDNDVSDVESMFSHSDAVDTQCKPLFSVSLVRPRPSLSFRFDMKFLRDHLNDTIFLNMDSDAIERRYKSKHKTKKKKRKKKSVDSPGSKLHVYPPLPHTAKSVRKTPEDEAIEEESIVSSSSVDDGGVNLIQSYEEKLADIDDEYKLPVVSPPPPVITERPPIVITMDDIDKKMAKTSQTLQSTFKRISEAEQTAAVIPSPAQVIKPEPEPEPEPPVMTSHQKYQKMKQRMENRKQERETRKESYLQYSMQLEHIKKMNDKVGKDEDGNNMLASMTLKKIDNIMEYKTRRQGRFGVIVHDSDSDDDEDDIDTESENSQ
ncbi:uncharacterized protein LOC144344192 [Saccoglossus kowalevskii]